MLSTFALTLAFTVSAPAVKDPPKKETPSIVGEWEGVEMIQGGQVEPIPKGGITVQFTADNKLAITEKGIKAKPDQSTYKIDFTKTPMEIDLIPPAELVKEKPLLGIVKFEEDKVIFCFTRGGEHRPTKFESTAGGKEMLMTLKRIKK